jgi:serine/threonine-protein kinase
MSPTLIDKERIPGDLDQQARRELGGRFRIEALHRRGPQSLVYRAAATSSTVPVALKVFPKNPVGDRVLRAAALASNMEHPHVVQILEWGDTGQLLWYTMPLVEGRSLDRLLAEEGPLELKRCLRIVEQIASAVQYGHRRGVVHGGIKPENVLIGDDGWTLLADFGIPGAIERAGNTVSSDRLLAYTAPELFESPSPVPASDQYALAVLIHESLTGAVPLVAGSPDEASPANPRISLPKVNGGPARRELPERVVPALRRALAPSPQERFPTVLALVSSLDGGHGPALANALAPTPNPRGEPRVLTMEPESRMRRLIVWIVVLALIGLAVAASSRVVRSERWQQISDRFQNWYEADAPPDGMVMQSAKPTVPARSTPSTALGAVNRAGDSSSESIQPTDAARISRPPSAPRPVAPRPVPQRAPVARKPAPAPAPVSTSSDQSAPGKLWVSSQPWGILYVDGRPVGNTPQMGMSLDPGTRSIRITHDGYAPFERVIDVAPGQEIRLIGIVLQETRR